MKDQLQLILKTLDKEYDTIVPQDFGDGQTTKEVFMRGVLAALIVVNGLDFLNVKETKP